ncbi:hypothetical protein C8Q79DRAFT_1008785 [Trametes meyenii]|nr:hypothetical protein C8Q79DRAFT_1008785 [Trametes meyenii]
MMKFSKAQEQQQSLTALKEACRTIKEQSAALLAAKADLLAAQVQGPIGGPQPGAEPFNSADHCQAEHLIPKPKHHDQYKIHTLVHASGLSWHLDFRHQEMDKLSKLYQGVAKVYPILKRYTHHWATAMIAQHYMQNICRYAREKGTEPKYAKYNRGGKGHAGNGGNALGDGDNNNDEVQDEDLL